MVACYPGRVTLCSTRDNPVGWAGGHRYILPNKDWDSQLTEEVSKYTQVNNRSCCYWLTHCLTDSILLVRLQKSTSTV